MKQDKCVNITIDGFHVIVRTRPGEEVSQRTIDKIAEYISQEKWKQIKKGRAMES